MLSRFSRVQLCATLWIDIDYMSTWLLTHTKAKEGNQWRANEYQADEQAGVARLRWRVSGS